MVHRSVSRFGALLVSVACGACVESAANNAPTSIEVVSGGGQTGYAGEELPELIIVMVKDASGGAVAGQAVNFVVTEGGGSVFAEAATSDSNGIAQEQWTLGPSTGLTPAPQALSARVIDSATGAQISASISASAIAHAPAQLSYAMNPVTYRFGVTIAANTPLSTGGPVVAYTVAPALVAGLALDASTGVISGTPSAVAAGSYTVTAANSGGTASVALGITVSPPPAPTISAQPANETVSIGQAASFSVTASGTGALAYQWLRNGAPIAGATQPTYALASPVLGDGGAVFSVVVSDAFGGSITSGDAVLTIQGFTSAGSMVTPRMGHTATLLPDGKVLIAGGYCPGPCASAELYDPVTGTFTGTGSLSVARGDHAAVLLANGKVLIVGGTDGAPLCDPPCTTPDPAQIAELYDPSTGLFTETGSLQSERIDPTATLLANNTVLVAGGNVQYAEISGANSSAELYDPTDGTFAYTGSMSIGRYSHSATLLADGAVLIAGGYSGFDHQFASSAAELYSPAAGTFSAVGSLVTARAEHTATLLTDGAVLLAGGVGNPELGDSGCISSAELYAPASGTFAATGSLLAARGGATATLLAGGEVLIGGGYMEADTNVPLASWELYSASASSFASTGDTAAARKGASATLLPSGEVLVCGGEDAAGLVSIAELFDPTSNP